MKKITYKDADFEAALSALFNRPGYPPEIEAGVKEILDEVRKNGDAALCRFAAEFDRVELAPELFRVTDGEIAAAGRALERGAKRAIREALAAVRSFARKRIPKDWTYSPRRGVTLGERFQALDRVGVYVPGGTAPLVSTVIHTAGIAGAAKVREIVAVTPPGPDGKIHPAVLYAMKKAGVTEIYRLGGVYGIAALAYGTESIRKVQKIVGPGNAYVTAAKKLVYGEVAIDMVAGPSEILIVADKTAPVEFIAADLLSQAEHGSGLEQAVLLTTDGGMADRVEAEIRRRKETLRRSGPIEKVLAGGLFLITVKDLNQAAKIAGDYAPEHLEILTSEPEKVARKIKAAGAIFLGPWTPEAIGDFCAGPSHVLPTAGSAKFFAGLTVEGFFRRSSLLKYRESALRREAAAAEKFGELEGLDAHAASISVRLEG